MPTLIKMPKLSDTMTEGTLLKWMIKKGDSVEMGQIIAEVETDKATMEMEAFDDGTVHEIYINEGDKIEVGGKMVALLADGEDPSDLDGADADDSKPESKEKEKSSDSDKDKKKSSDSDKKETDKKEDDKKDKDKKESSKSASTPSSQPTAQVVNDGERVRASPLAKKIAKEKGIPLSALKGRGTGPGGRVVKADVLKADEEGVTAKPSASANAAPASAQPTIMPKVGDDDEVVQLSTMRKIIADRLLASKTQLPHFYLRMEVDAGPLMELRKQVNASEAQRENGNKYSVNDFILKATIGAASVVTDINASWNGDSIVKFAKIGLSVAISVDDGLVTPVIKDAANKSLLDISKAVKDLAVRSRDKKLKPDEFDGGTITVSNLGAWGIDHFDAIINPPQAAIVSVGAIKEKPVVVDGEVKVGLRMWLGLSCDHRVVDGAVAATFLAELGKRIEQPALMLV